MENARLGKLIRIAEGRRNGRKKNEFHDLFYFIFFFNICDSFVVKTCLNFFFPFFLFFSRNHSQLYQVDYFRISYHRFQFLKKCNKMLNRNGKSRGTSKQSLSGNLKSDDKERGSIGKKETEAGRETAVPTVSNETVAAESRHQP